MAIIRHSANVLVLGAALLLTLLLGCRIKAGDSDRSGNKKVDIQTPVGNLHVSTAAEASDTGLAVYPGARVVEKQTDHSANINVSTSAFGLKVVALHYESDDPVEKVASFYSEELKKYGPVLRCRTSKSEPDVRAGKNEKETAKAACDNDETGKTVELKVGSENNQHIVAISPKGKGSEFALVRVHVRTGETI